jgi:hypothetical protein
MEEREVLTMDVDAVMDAAGRIAREITKKE